MITCVVKVVASFFLLAIPLGALAAEYETAPAVSISREGGNIRYIDGVVRLDCEKEEASVADTFVPYFECSYEGGWFRAASPDMNFSYNTAWREFPKKWENEGVSYSLVSKRVSKVHGDVYRVVGYDVSAPGVYFLTDFSFKSGIVGFYYLNEDSEASRWFLLSSKFGVGRKQDRQGKGL